MGEYNEKIKEIYQKILNMTADVTEDHVGAYAAQSAYFFMLCMIPIILLLITMVQYTPVTKADVMTAVIQVFRTSVDSMITSIVITNLPESFRLQSPPEKAFA